MKKEGNNKNLIIWLEEIWEEIEIQFFGIAGAICFFILYYIIYHPPWMRPLIDIFLRIKLSLLSMII
tara:strand:- start:28 stop:228 length:201 start_codon:yes stop_codon:yes gene_type:complete